jgi:hypothetical protein
MGLRYGVAREVIAAQPAGVRAEIVRVIVRERCTKPSETSLKLFALRADFIGSCGTTCVGV